MKTSSIDHKILSELNRRTGWVSTVRLGRYSNSFAVHSAIARLRLRGFDIRHRPSRSPLKKGWYRLSK